MDKRSEECLDDSKESIQWDDSKPEEECYCTCGAVFHSQSKVVRSNGVYNKIHTRKECPGCGSNTDVWRTVSPSVTTKYYSDTDTSGESNDEHKPEI